MPNMQTFTYEYWASHSSDYICEVTVEAENLDQADRISDELKPTDTAIKFLVGMSIR